jgi:hypothetical protein
VYGDARELWLRNWGAGVSHANADDSIHRQPFLGRRWRDEIGLHGYAPIADTRSPPRKPPSGAIQFLDRALERLQMTARGGGTKTPHERMTAMTKKRMKKKKAKKATPKRSKLTGRFKKG